MAASELLKKVTIGFLELVNNFTEASKNFVIYITTAKSFRFLKTISARTKSKVLFFYPWRVYIS